MMQTRIFRRLLLPLLLLATMICGCNRAPQTALTAEVQRLSAELEATRLKLEASEKANVQKREDLAIAVAPEIPKAAPMEVSPMPNAEKDLQIRALQAQLAEIKKRDVFAFADASSTVRTGTVTAALERYQQFLREFPNSPLAADADRAIAELNTTVQREARALTQNTDPRQPERDALQHFKEGTATVREITLLLKNRNAAETIKLLGPPSQTYRDGKELGYSDKIIDPTTGNRGTLVIGYDGDLVSSLRVGYLGKPIRP